MPDTESRTTPFWDYFIKLYTLLLKLGQSKLECFSLLKYLRIKQTPLRLVPGKAKKLSSDKHSSLFLLRGNYNKKVFYNFFR
jgi:hypothetical protein